MPIVMCTGYYDDELINAASRIGVYAYVVKPCRLANLLTAINLAISRFQEARLLRNEVDSLKEALSTRKVVEQAKGIIMRTRGLPEESAHKFLQQESQRQSRSLGELAKAIVVAHESLRRKSTAKHGRTETGVGPIPFISAAEGFNREKESAKTRKGMRLKRGACVRGSNPGRELADSALPSGSILCFAFSPFAFSR